MTSQDWTDQPLFDVDMPETKKPRPAPKGARWARTNHSRFTCQDCIADPATLNYSDIRSATFIRVEDGKTATYCNEHAEERKHQDQKDGKWRTQT